MFFKTEDEFREVNTSKIFASFILEPFGRNTAPAIAAAALQVEQMHGADALLLVLAADHLIADQAAFHQAVLKAVELAQQGKIATFGIQPDAPEIGYGYIESENNRVLRFVEKPSLDKAQEYLASGRFLWNSGIFCFAAGIMLEQMKRYCPAILTATRSCIEKSRLATGIGFNQLELDASTFSNVPDDSIDYAVMEKSDQVAVVPCNIGWSDIGSWAALGNLNGADADGNRIQGEAMLHNTRNSTIQTDGRLVSAVGVNNLIIVDTSDALLVVDKAHVQDVKHIFTNLKTQGHETHKLHRTVHRPWGTYTVLEAGQGFKIKRIEVKPGASLSLQMHRHRSEHWVMVRGTATVVNGEQEFQLQPNQSTYIPAGHKHRLTNLGTSACVIIEVQCGSYVGEDDIVRYEDAYRRDTLPSL